MSNFNTRNLALVVTVIVMLLGYWDLKQTQIKNRELIIATAASDRFRQAKAEFDVIVKPMMKSGEMVGNGFGTDGTQVDSARYSFSATVLKNSSFTIREFIRLHVLPKFDVVHGTLTENFNWKITEKYYHETNDEKKTIKYGADITAELVEQD